MSENAPWRPLDCHAHSTFSDGSLNPDEVVDVAQARGVRASIADHISRDVQSSVKSVEAVREYLAGIAPFDVLRGGEFCYHDALWREIPDDLRNEFTHAVGSLHAIQLTDDTWLHMWPRGLPDGLTRDAYMEAHLATLERFAAEMPVDILAHPTLLPLPMRGIPLEELWTEAREARALKALKKAGIAFEISNRYRPHERFARHAVAMGVRISLGSDGHSVDQVADIAWPLALARSLGVRDEDLYDPAVHGTRWRTPRHSAR